MVFQPRADLQNQAIGWLPKGCSSYGSGMVVRFSRIWVSVSSGESRFRRAGGDPTLVADDNLHPSGKVYTPWGDTIVPLAELALLKEETPWRLVPCRPMTLWFSPFLRQFWSCCSHFLFSSVRSEERRVGKECCPCWWLYHQ